MTAEIVEAVKESHWMKDGVETTTYWVTLVDGVGQREVPCYDPRGKDLKEDTPLPEGWEVKTSKAGKPYLAAPRQSSGGGSRDLGRSGAPAAWRNTEAGAKYEDERVDRRRALEQAIAMNYPAETPFGHILTVAGELYAWLRESVSAPRSGGRDKLGTADNRPDASRRHEEKGRGPADLRVGADTPSDEGGGQLNKRGSLPSTENPSAASQDSPPPSSSTKLETSGPEQNPRRLAPNGDWDRQGPDTPSHADKWTPAEFCQCGQPYGPKTTPSGKRICLGGHVERFDYA